MGRDMHINANMLISDCWNMDQSATIVILSSNYLLNNCCLGASWAGWMDGLC